MTYQLTNEIVINDLLGIKQWDGHADYVKFRNYTPDYQLLDEGILLCILNVNNKLFCDFWITNTLLSESSSEVVTALIENEYKRLLDIYNDKTQN